MLNRKVLFVVLCTALHLKAQFPDFTPPTPLFRVVLMNDTAAAKQLLEQGANPNEGQFLGFPPVFFPVMYQNLELFRAMVARGADVKAKDGSGSTALMWASYSESGDPALAEELLKMGLDPNVKNLAGETALTWAQRRGDTPVVAVLRKTGASESEILRSSVEKGIALLQKSEPQFVKVSGCTSCHHQSLPQMAFGFARQKGFKVDETIASQQVKTVVGMFKPMQDEMNNRTQKIPDPPISISYSLLGLAAENYSPDATTDAMARLIAAYQRPDGSFRTLPMRPPIESSSLTATALSIRALQVYGKAPESDIERAARWLSEAAAKSTEDRAMQLLGLTWAKAGVEALQAPAQALLETQRTDGGWSQLPTLETDAYATGQALVALQQSGIVSVNSPAYRRGVTFLLRTQIADGSWLVRARAYPFQPYKESGFPHGKDQWISASGTSWAIMALSLAAPGTQVSPQLLSVR